MSGTGAAQPTTLSDAVGSVWNSVSSLGQQVTQSIVDTASAWMAPPGSEEEGEGLGAGMEGGNVGGAQEAQGYMAEQEARPVRQSTEVAQTEVHRRKKPASKKAD